MLDGRIQDVAVIGGGIVGLATARALARASAATVAVLEAEDGLAAHQTGHNSGVMHSGLYYRPGSLKARLCVAGRRALIELCAEHGVAHEVCGKLVVATRPDELPRLDELERRGRANGLEGLERLGPGALREREPHVAGRAALLVPATGIVDFAAATAACAADLGAAGGTVHTGARVARARRTADGFVLESARGALQARHVIGCAGLHADRVARACGADPGASIVPFRGEYWALAPGRLHLVNHLVYPVPDPRFPFLGVHFTRLVRGGVEAGPNAVLALARHGYRRRDVSPRDLAEMLAYGGFWRMASRHLGRGLEESWRSHVKRAFVAALQRLVPELREDDVTPAGAGVRAQALGPDGALLDDFHLVHAERGLHVINAPSPAATAALAIGGHVAALAIERFGLRGRG